jgi:hypothetical protein
LTLLDLINSINLVIWLKTSNNNRYIEKRNDSS